jgi:hypothetical protein
VSKEGALRLIWIILCDSEEWVKTGRGLNMVLRGFGVLSEVTQPTQVEFP